jgi:hypothetical protein
MKKPKQNLLKKKISELTPEDKAQLEKVLGTFERPFPMWGTQRVEAGNTSTLTQVLSVIAVRPGSIEGDEPLKIYSDRDYREVVALAYCDMPTPSMLPLFLDGLERRKPESTNRTQMMIGDPGAGKSFLGAMQGRLRTSESVEVLDCGGKNMRELLFEMVLDFGAGDALPDAIDKRIAAGTLKPLSEALLRQIDSDIDAEITELTASGKSTPEALAALDARRLVSVVNGDIVSIDWNAMKTAGTDKVSATFETLKKVSKIEGLDNAGGNALGMNSQYGPLIRKFIAGEEIVLDEYNKSREGTDDNLQTVWQFMIGEIKECTVENPLKNKDNTSGPSEFSFRREDTKAGFFVTLTGNKKEDGITTRSLNKSVYSRLSPETLPDPDTIDWQHRLCQMMTGVPVSTLYTVFSDTADANPEEFGKWLLWLRRTKAEIEGVPVPEYQETLLANWKNVVSASLNMAKLYEYWATVTDAEKITNGHSDLIEEVDEEYTKKEGIDFRKIKQHIEQALSIRPRMQKEDAPRMLQMGAWDKAPVMGEKVPENLSLNFGTRYVEFLEHMIYAKTEAIGKKRLYKKLEGAMKENNLREVVLLDAQRSDAQSVEQALNISSFSDRDLKKQARLAQKIFCDYLRQIDPEIKATDEQIVTSKKIQDALQYIRDRDTAPQNELFVPNRDHETLGVNPIVSAVVKDSAYYTALENKTGQKVELDFVEEDLVEHDDFLASLALPTVGEKNLGSIWNKTLRELDSSAPGAADTATDPAMLMAENDSKTGVGTTTVQVRYQDGDDMKIVSVHVVRNNVKNKTLIVSEKAPSKLLAAFREAGIIHVDRNGASAATQVESALTELTRGFKQEDQNRLVDAFKYRNETVGEGLQNNAATLSELLVDPKIDMSHPKYVVKTFKR